MGRITSDSTTVIEFEDRTLAHLQLVIGAKLRRNESFFFSWKDDPANGDGRSTVWMHATIPLVFKFYGSRLPALNRAWFEAMMATANSSHGLQLVPEPEPPTQNGHHLEGV